MIGEAPYRKPDRTLTDEEELWYSLDQALERAFGDPVWAWGVAWQVARDAGSRFPEVRDAAASLMQELQPGR